MNSRCLVQALKSRHHPLVRRSHLWLFWCNFREQSSALSSRALRASVSPAIKLRGGIGWRRWRKNTGAEFEFAQRCNRILQPTLQSPCQPTSRPDFPTVGTGLLAPAAASHGYSWHDLCELGSASDVRCRLGRPRPDGHLVAKLALVLHHFLHHSISY